MRSLARKSVDKVLELEPDPNSFQANWSQGYYYYYGSRNYDQALRYFSLALQSQPNNADVISSIGYVKRRQGKFQESLILLRRSCDLDPKSWRNWFELGYLELIMRRYKDAEEHFTRSMVVFGQKSTGVAGTHALAIFSIKGDIKAARKVFDDEVDETASWTYQERNVQFHIAEGDLAAAREGLARSVLSQPDINPVNYYSMLATVYARTSQDEKARACYDSGRVYAENFLKQNPDDWAMHSNLGQILAHLGQKERAIAEGKKAVELMPLEKDALDAGPGALYGLAEIYAVAGEPDASMDVLEQLLGLPNIYTTYFIQIDPELEQLKRLPRFTRLIEKYKIE
jgi:tetratricopeptide (TPR) repeat protein